MMKRFTVLCLAPAMMLFMGGCPEDPVPPDTIGIPDSTVDIVPDTPDDGGTDDGGPDTDVEIIEGECSDDDLARCTEKFKDELTSCNEVACTIDGTCVLNDIADCCLADADCSDFTVEACFVAVCGDGNQCTSEFSADAGESCCDTASDCAASTETCSEATCTDGACGFGDIANCCETSADCDTPASCCESAACDTATNSCTVAALDGCCETSGECDDGNPSTTDICASSCSENGCESTAPACETETVFKAVNFDSGSLTLVKIIDGDTSDTITWRPSAKASTSPGYSAYLSAEGCPTYYNGPLNSECEPAQIPWDSADLKGFATTMVLEDVAIGDDAGAYLGFWVRMSAEAAFYVPELDQTVAADGLQVSVVETGAPTKLVWASHWEDAIGIDQDTKGAFVYQAVKLDEYAGKTVDLRFTFIADSNTNYAFDQESKPYEGVFLDDIQVQTYCAGTTCTPGEGCSSDGNGCTSDSCTPFSGEDSGVCGYQTASVGESCTPCGVPADCGTDECFDYACTDSACDIVLKGECCLPNSSFPTATAAGELSDEGFEGGDISAWTLDDPYDDNVSWQVSGGTVFDGSMSLSFGDPATSTFVAVPTNPAVATIWTPSFVLDDDEFRTQLLTFQLFMSTEFNSATTLPTHEFDKLSVYIRVGIDEPISIWTSKEELFNSTKGKWAQVGADLSPWRGQEIRIGFGFDSGESPGNSVANDGLGVRIDSLSVVSVCGDSPCVTGTDCSDGDTCSDDICDLGVCTNPSTDTTCCDAPEDCDDGNPLTFDACDEGVCGHGYDYNKATSGQCSDAPGIGLWTAGFEGGDSGFSVPATDLPAFWRRVDDDASEGVFSFNFSDPATGTYDIPNPCTGSETPEDGELCASCSADWQCGWPESGLVCGDNVCTPKPAGTLVSPIFEIPPYGTPYAEFWLFMETEWDASTDKVTSAFPIDTLRVHIAIGGMLLDAEVAWSSLYLGNTTDGAWVKTRVDLRPFKLDFDDNAFTDFTVEDWASFEGESAQLLFSFDSYDGNNNGFAGPFVDDVSFGLTCKAGVQCLNGAQCAPMNNCNTVACSDDFTCVNTPKDTPECCEPSDAPSKGIDFEVPLDEGWTFVPCDPGAVATTVIDDTAVWQISNTEGPAPFDPMVTGVTAVGGEQFLYFGNGTDIGAAAGGGSCGVARSPAFTLDADVPWSMRFVHYLDVEKHSGCNPAEPAAPFADQVEIRVVDVETGLTAFLPVWRKSQATDSVQVPFPGCGQFGKWQNIVEAIDMSEWAGQTIQLEFFFTTWDAEANEGTGVAFDNLYFEKGCPDF